MDDPNIYLKRKSYPYGECWSSSLQIPIALGTASKGGLISETQKVCFGADFKGIDNVEEASGEWIAPKHAEMKWSYGWQWSQDSVKWVKIEDSNSILVLEDDAALGSGISLALHSPNRLITLCTTIA